MALATAREHHRRSILIARRAVTEARKVQGRGLVALASVVATHQVAQAQTSEAAVTAMLAEQGTPVAPMGALQVLAFTTATDALAGMVESAGDIGFDRLVESLVQSAGRAAESVSVAARPKVGYIRNLNPPVCSRCAVLGGRWYRYSEGFLRHPQDDCTMTPATSADPDLIHDPVDLARRGLVHGLSKADRRALADGADFNQVVNIRRAGAGLSEAGRVLARRGRPTPEGIYRIASDQSEAVDLLRRFGYLLP